MTHRRSSRMSAAARAWDRFVSANAAIIATSGIPRSYLASVDHFDDFLMHGRLAYHADDTDYHLESMNADQYAGFVLLVESYFAAGYEWFTPVVLRPAELHRLRSRFGGAE